MSRKVKLRKPRDSAHISRPGVAQTSKTREAEMAGRKRPDKGSRRGRGNFEVLFENNPHPTWVYDLETLQFLEVNKAAIAKYGFSRDEFLGMRITDIRPQEDVALLIDNLHEKRPILQSSQWRHRCKDGRILDLEVSSHLTQHKRRKAAVVVAQDITERKQAEEALRASEARTRLIVDTAHDAFIAMDAGGFIVDWNQRAEITFGWSREEAIGRPLGDTIIPPQYREAHKRGLKHFLATGEGPVLNKRFEIMALHRDGHEFPVELTIRPIRLEQGYIFNSFLHDITEKKQAEEALRLAKEDAERTSKFKDQFLSTMSHELRTPLNAVLGFSELLTDGRYGPLNERQRRYIQHIQEGGRHLLRLISDILDLSKIEAGRFELAVESVSVERAVAEVSSALEPLVQQKSQKLSWQVEPGLGVRADATRFKQILMNLLGNAIKFTPEDGRIELLARLVDSEVRVEVRDTGPGIPAEEQKRIFEAFYRLPQGDRLPEGTGLGLAITKRLVELQGGGLNLESEPGRGSCFYFSLPAIEAIQPKPSEPAGVRLGTAELPRIMVIEDDPAARQIIRLQLTSSGYEVILCEQPDHALEMAAELQPHAITLDLLMKPVDGLQLLFQLKDDPRTVKIPVIVLTIVDQPAVGSVLGADEYLVKPVERSTLLAAVERCLGARGARQATQPILVVEDDGPTCEIIAELLTTEGYSVATVNDGAQARAWVNRSIPELIILDLLLPEVSGFELLADWRAHPRTADLPVFVLTGKDLTHEEERYLRAHAESLFRKRQPWQEALIQQVRRATARRGEAG